MESDSGQGLSLSSTTKEPHVARIDRFVTRADADLACGLLVAHGINAFVSVDDAGGMRPDIAFGIGGTAIVVPDEELDDALALLDTPAEAEGDTLV